MAQARSQSAREGSGTGELTGVAAALLVREGIQICSEINLQIFR
jgi:hypothetical protein